MCNCVYVYRDTPIVIVDFTGRLVEAYDELGNRYVIPKYCISKPSNMAGSNGSSRPQAPLVQRQPSLEDTDSTTNLLPDSPSSPTSRTRTSSQTRHKAAKKPKSKGNRSPLAKPQKTEVDIVPTGDPIVLKIRVSTLSKDIKMTLQASDRVRDIKRRLCTDHDVSATNITMLYAGRVLSDRTYVKSLEIPRGFIIQAIVT